MVRTLKTMAIALVAAIWMTGSASAITSVTSGGSYDITSDDFFTGTVSTNGGGGFFSVNFTSPINNIVGNANASVTMRVLSSFSNLTMTWVDAATGTALNSVMLVAGVASLDTMFTAANTDGQNLVFSWSNSASANGGPITFDFDVAAVPLPAGGLLLLTALGGLVLTRRRKEAA